ncbi:hypothetical protein [Persephonella sp.]
MGKIVKFNLPKEVNTQKSPDKENTANVKSIYSKKTLYMKIWDGLEEYILNNFAVKKVLGIDFIYKENDHKEIGLIGVLDYEHKRREGNFLAEFIAKGYIDTKKDKVIIDIVVFKQGEVELYKSTEKILKAKKIYPEIILNEGD